jgi:hypothetical protein
MWPTRSFVRAALSAAVLSTTAPMLGALAVLGECSVDRLIRQVKGPNVRALVIGFRSGGRQIAVVYGDAQVKVWDVESGREASSVLLDRVVASPPYFFC